MVRRIRSAALESRTSRLKLAIRKKPYCATIAPRLALAYRRNQGPGVWSVKSAAGLSRFALADDHEPANGATVQDYWQALETARSLGRAGEGSTDRLATVTDALDSYEADLKARGGDKRNVSGLRFNLTDTLKAKSVALLTVKELRSWRNSLVENGVTAATASRVGRSFKAALNLAARADKRITNSNVWREGLEALPDDVGDGNRNIILPDDVVSALVRGGYDESQSFGVFLELLAVTGARESQVLRLRVQDLQDGAAPRLHMPSSRKGRRRKLDYKPLAITPSLAAALRQIDRAPGDLLFGKIHDLVERFRVVAKRVGLGPETTPYSLRHSSIVRQLLNGIPVRVVASHHDTSVLMIERTYSRHIVGDPSDAMIRRSLPDFSAPAPAGNVVPIIGR